MLFQCLSVPANQLNFSELVPIHCDTVYARYSQDYTYTTGRSFHAIDNICFDAHLQLFCSGNTPLQILRLSTFVLIAMIRPLCAISA